MSTEVKETTDIAIIVRDNPGIVLFDAPKYDEFFQKKKQEVESFVADITTESGRKAIASLAYSVAREKTKLDNAGKAAKEQALLTCQKVDEARRKITADFDALRDQARKPLDDWEATNKAREEKAREIIATLNTAAVVPMDATAESIKAALDAVRLIDTASLQEFATTADAAKRLAFTSLSSAVIRLEKEAAERAELERLRAEAEARRVAEIEAARIKEEERLRAAAEEQARLAEEKRKADEQARIERAAKEAEEKARQAAEKAAREAAEKIEREHAAELKRLKDASDKKEADRLAEIARAEATQRAEAARIAAEHQAELDKARRAKEEAEAQQRAEAKRIADAEAARVAEAARLKKIADDKAAEDERLAKNKKHRQELMTAAKLALMAISETEGPATNISEACAIAIVKAIIADKIPQISMRFTS